MQIAFLLPPLTPSSRNNRMRFQGAKQISPADMARLTAPQQVGRYTIYPIEALIRGLYSKYCRWNYLTSGFKSEKSVPMLAMLDELCCGDGRLYGAQAYMEPDADQLRALVQALDVLTQLEKPLARLAIPGDSKTQEYALTPKGLEVARRVSQAAGHRGISHPTGPQLVEIVQAINPKR